MDGSPVTLLGRWNRFSSSSISNAILEMMCLSFLFLPVVEYASDGCATDSVVGDGDW